MSTLTKKQIKKIDGAMEAVKAARANLFVTPEEYEVLEHAYGTTKIRTADGGEVFWIVDIGKGQCVIANDVLAFLPNKVAWRVGVHSSGHLDHKKSIENFEKCQEAFMGYYGKQLALEDKIDSSLRESGGKVPEGAYDDEQGPLAIIALQAAAGREEPLEKAKKAWAGFSDREKRSTTASHKIVCGPFPGKDSK